MRESSNSKIQPINIKGYFWTLLAIWTVFVGMVLLWSLIHQQREMLEVARINARAAFQKDLVYRQWVASHGGVYVPKTEKTPPNPYLTHVEERDITTPSGRSLTLINPAYMTREVHELGKRHYGLQGHITSLNPIRPENSADLWESEALRSFEQSVAEVSSVEELDGVPHMRLMRPLITEEGCMRCHAEHGYKPGDVRGGISVSIPMPPLTALARSHAVTLTLGHGLLWFLGVCGIFLGTSHLSSRIRDHFWTEEDLKRSEERYALAQRSANIGSWDWDIGTNGLIWSEQIEPMFGFNRGEFGATYESFLGCVHPEDRQYVIDSVKASVEENKDYVIEHRIVWPNGTVRWVLETGDVIRDESGIAIRMLGIVQDITKRKIAEESLRKARNELEQRVEGRTAELNRLNKQLEQEIEERKQVGNALRESEKQLQSLSSQLLTFQEQERKRVALELHDSVGQILAALKYRVEGAINQVSEGTVEKCTQSLEDIIPKIQDAVEEVDRIGKGLRPLILDDLGIIATYSWFCREFEETYPEINIEKEINIHEEEVSDLLKVAMYRILQEGLNNIAKHSRADLVNVSLKKTDQAIELTIKDNGRGFNLESTLSPEIGKRGLGLISMIKRTELSGGSLTIKSNDKTGTTLQAIWPC